ncbi:3-deoxy-8-phosphooctulonate synthase [Phycisphaera mikurensis]|uniref:3-deoxy-8-phosphooctulonate synthase n=1 Tax=Phycisphaera mikurensis (strain NBRC 102666 / KCTC 22515 / FYK2301M01) TaxID=1142394 RepID=I0IET3_PHYMF|nr:3-deoxy-8-phosphooctulonate synthase [Phycisphaera mikurensis]MBB6441566.1 2-dehydro-3-deoxyphosphooctonate aldolase (KDO 8-P synthase) [Phycisphaera mikurensis]BAM03771.1 2-dehydro-3-deoxyphosphooctonate aldolase [Phycisphaera mikurensis NBRC 102666]
MKPLELGPAVSVTADGPLTILAGPCQAESYELCVRVGEALRDACEKLGLGYVFKASFDKANRTSAAGRRGPGVEAGLELLARAKAALGVPLTTDVHLPDQPTLAVQAGVDLLQVPAFLCRQTDLLAACAATPAAVNVKKGQFLSPAEMGQVVEKVTRCRPDAPRVMVTDRGTFFGYHRLVNDFAGVGDLIDLGVPVCFDATHSVQQPGAAAGGTATGGRRERAPLLARCAVAAGVHALFLETHPDPDAAASDAAVMLPLEKTLELLPALQRLHDAARG